jgi:hypothetical protein
MVRNHASNVSRTAPRDRAGRNRETRSSFCHLRAPSDASWNPLVEYCWKADVRALRELTGSCAKRVRHFHPTEISNHLINRPQPIARRFAAVVWRTRLAIAWKAEDRGAISMARCARSSPPLCAKPPAQVDDDLFGA